MDSPTEHGSSVSGNDNAEALDRQTQARLDEIESQIKKDQPLTSKICPLSTLEAEYKETANFLVGIKDLQNNYGQMRMVRGDGNCFYRAFLYRLAEDLVAQTSDDNKRTMLQRIKDESWKNILAAGYDEMMMEVFYDTIVDLLEQVVNGKLDAVQLHDELNQETSTSDYCTWYLRAVTAAHLKSNADRFLPFMEGGIDVDAFCKANVEPMGKECENVQVHALAEALSVQVVVAYLDGHELVNGKVAEHVFGPSMNPSMTLNFLYRPGHYDILYSKF